MDRNPIANVMLQVNRTAVYYFQVTDPSGKVNLSKDDPIAQRQVEVINGVFINSTVTVHFVAQDDSEYTHRQMSAASMSNFFPSTVRQILGANIKFGLRRFSDYDTSGTLGSFGFIPSKSKTDNFKVIGIDSDGDGIQDGEDACPNDPLNVLGCDGVG